MARSPFMSPRSADSARSAGEPPRVDEAASQPGPVWAIITGQAAGTNRYHWKQLDDGDAPAFGDNLSAGFAAAGTSATDGYPAYELNGRDDVPTDGSAKVQVWPAGT